MSWLTRWKERDEPELSREFQVGHFQVLVSTAPQVLYGEMPEADVSTLSDQRVQEPHVPVPLLKDALRRAGTARGQRPFVSAAMLMQKAKQFDDGLYAAADLAAQQGAGRSPGKAQWLPRLLAQIADSPEAATKHELAHILFSAARLGGMSATVPPLLIDAVNQQVEAFLADPLRSKPIGFYSWNESLGRIFQQDRLLQTRFGMSKEDPGTELLLRALHQPEFRSAYESYLNFVSRLTNPLVDSVSDLRAALASLDTGEFCLDAGEYAFFPPSRALETDIAKELFGNRPVPPDFQLFDEMIKRLRDGRLPHDRPLTNGWYGYQTWSVFPLALPKQMPEAEKILLGREYCKHLEQLLKGIWALARETHIKQLEIPFVIGCVGERPRRERAIITIAPALSVEPLSTHYLRRAAGYAFVRSVLESHFGLEGLQSMRRLTPEGPVTKSLDEELRDMQALFHGAFHTVSRELGVPAAGRDEHLRQVAEEGSLPADRLGSGRGAEADMDHLEKWARATDDPDLNRDMRMMVPVFFDAETGKTRVWVFLGWQVRSARFSFVHRPKVRVLQPNGRKARWWQVRINYDDQQVDLATPVVAELSVRRILNRAEFRAHCDRWVAQEAILENLE